MTIKLRLDGPALVEAIKEKKFHCRTELANRIQQISEITGNSILGSLEKTNSCLFKRQSDSVIDGIPVYINRNGGFFIGLDGYDVLKINPIKEDMEHLLFPKEEGKYTEKDIRILQWAPSLSHNGKATHYYAKIGDLDVKVNDELKWNTENETREKAKWFLNNIVEKIS